MSDEPAGAGRLERGDEGALALDPGTAVGRLVEKRQIAEEFVFDGEQGAPARREMAAAFEPERLAAGGPVEGLGDRRPPIDDHDVALAIPDAEPADVEALAAEVVDAAEDQRPAAQIELGKPPGDRLVEHVALETGLAGASGAHFGEVGQAHGGRPRGFETFVGVVEIRLLCLELGMVLWHLVPLPLVRPLRRGISQPIGIARCRHPEPALLGADKHAAGPPVRALGPKWAAVAGGANIAACLPSRSSCPPAVLPRPRSTAGCWRPCSTRPAGTPATPR